MQIFMEDVKGTCGMIYTPIKEGSKHDKDHQGSLQTNSAAFMQHHQKQPRRHHARQGGT